MTYRQWIILIGLLVCTHSHAASFDCEQARSSIEKLICSNDELSELDSQLGNSYRTAKQYASTPRSKQVVDAQPQWLRNVRNRCSDAGCLLKVYKERINELRSQLEIPHFDKSRGVSDDMNVVGFSCDQNTKSLELGFFTGYNAPDERMELWGTFDLKINRKDADIVEAVLEIERTCTLGVNRYAIKIRGVPGNWNLNGECGARDFAGATIYRNGQVIFNKNFEECNSEGVITRVAISTQNSKPVVTRVTHKEFYGN